MTETPTPWSGESKALAIEVVKLFKGQPTQVCLTALVLTFAATIDALKMDTDRALDVFSEQVRRTVEIVASLKEKETVQ